MRVRGRKPGGSSERGGEGPVRTPGPAGWAPKPPGPAPTAMAGPLLLALSWQLPPRCALSWSWKPAQWRASGGRGWPLAGGVGDQSVDQAAVQRWRGRSGRLWWPFDVRLGRGRVGTPLWPWCPIGFVSQILTLGRVGTHVSALALLAAGGGEAAHAPLAPCGHSHSKRSFWSSWGGRRGGWWPHCAIVDREVGPGSGGALARCCDAEGVAKWSEWGIGRSPSPPARQPPAPDSPPPGVAGRPCGAPEGTGHAG